MLRRSAKYDVGVGPLIRKLVLPSSASTGALWLQFEGKTYLLARDREFDFTRVDPAGATTFRLLTADPHRGSGDRDFIVGLGFMQAGQVALSQEPLSIPAVLSFALGRYAPKAPNQVARFALAAVAPEFPVGVFAYEYPPDHLRMPPYATIIGMFT